MTLDGISAREIGVALRAARFRVSTFEACLAAPDNAELVATLPDAHRAALEAISESHHWAAATVSTAASTAVVHWFTGEDLVCECLEFDDEVLVLQWPGDEDVLALRIAAAIGFDHDHATGWRPETDTQPTVPLADHQAAALREGQLPTSLALAAEASCVRLQSRSSAGDNAEYEVVLLMAADGPFLLDPGPPAVLARVGPTDLWAEIHAAISGWDDHVG